jgi:predicted kinase
MKTARPPKALTAPAFHLICGPTGAGKTTYSLDLAQRLNGVRFSIDEWMVSLFGKDRPEPLPFDWIAERVGRCEQQIGPMAAQCARAGVAVVLDLSFRHAGNRADFAAIAGQAGCPVVLHLLDLPVDERWNRVRARNESRGKTCSLPVSQPIFDFMERLWQPPSAAEMTAYHGIHAAS